MDGKYSGEDGRILMMPVLAVIEVKRRQFVVTKATKGSAPIILHLK
jgi:hypothetical protein